MSGKKIFSQHDIESFLSEMRSILKNPEFNVNKDLLFIKKRKSDDPDDDFTNENTMLELEYDVLDIVNELLQLSPADYIESMSDTVVNNGCYLHVFGRTIKSRDIYIKIRIKARKTGCKYVFCVSFHFARYALTNFPYK